MRFADMFIPPRPPFPQANAPSWMKLYDLITYESPTKKIRLGSKHDGGYVVASGLEYDLFLSGGIEGNIDFENDFLKIHSIPCIGFDGTIQSIPANANPRIQFVKKNIGFVESENLTNLHMYLDTYKNIFLKMDIEGGEYDWIRSCSQEQLGSLKQIVLEVHWPMSEEKWDLIFGKLRKTHWLIHVHGNNHCGCFQLEGRPIPEVLECTYLRKSDWPDLNLNTRGFPHDEVDSPNCPTNPEHGLRGFPFECLPNA